MPKGTYTRPATSAERATLRASRRQRREDNKLLDRYRAAGGDDVGAAKGIVGERTRTVTRPSYSTDLPPAASARRQRDKLEREMLGIKPKKR